MDDASRLQIERECERLVTLYCHLVDHGEAAKVAELFSEDACWSGPGVEMRGIEELRAGFRQREANRARMSRHVCTNLRVEVEAPDRASGCCYLTLYRHDGAPERETSPLFGPALVGEYRDRFVRGQDGWRFAERCLHVSFVRREGADGG